MDHEPRSSPHASGDCVVRGHAAFAHEVRSCDRTNGCVERVRTDCEAVPILGKRGCCAQRIHNCRARGDLFLLLVTDGRNAANPQSGSGIHLYTPISFASEGAQTRGMSAFVVLRRSPSSVRAQ